MFFPTFQLHAIALESYGSLLIKKFLNVWKNGYSSDKGQNKIQRVMCEFLKFFLSAVERRRLPYQKPSTLQNP